MAKVKVNPLVLLLGILLFSFSSSWFKPEELCVIFFITLVFPYFWGINSLLLMWRMKVMLFTALLIFIFGLIEERSTITTIGETVRFLTLIELSAIFVLKADLIALSSTLGGLLSVFLKKTGWRIASAIMLSLSIFPLVFSSAEEMLESRRSRLGSFFSHPIKNLTEYTISLISLLLYKTVAFQDALYSRSYSTTKKRTQYSLKLSDWLVLILFILLFLGVIIWKKIL